MARVYQHMFRSRYVLKLLWGICLVDQGVHGVHLDMHAVHACNMLGTPASVNASELNMPKDSGRGNYVAAHLCKRSDVTCYGNGAALTSPACLVQWHSSLSSLVLARSRPKLPLVLLQQLSE